MPQGLSPQVRYQRRCRKLGLCIVCARESGGPARCRECNRKRVLRVRRRRRLLRLVGSCVDCEAALGVSVKRFSRCLSCREKRADKARLRRQKVPEAA